MTTPTQRIEEAIEKARDQLKSDTTSLQAYRLSGMIEGWQMVIMLLEEYDDGGRGE